MEFNILFLLSFLKNASIEFTSLNLKHLTYPLFKDLISENQWKTKKKKKQQN